MKTIIGKTAALLAVSAALLSFSPRGGEGFEISVNNKVVIQRYGPNIDKVTSLQVNASSPEDKITISYHHCGKVGKNRVLTFRDQQDKLIKEWRFADATSSVSVMSCTVKDLLPLMKGSTVLKLYYTSSELPKGRMLTSITTDNNSVAKMGK